MLSILHTDSSLNLTAGFKGFPAATVSVSGATFPLKSLTPQVHTLSDCSQEVGVSVVWGTEDEGERRAANGSHVTWSAGNGIQISVTIDVQCKYIYKPISSSQDHYRFVLTAVTLLLKIKLIINKHECLDNVLLIFKLYF